MNENQRRSTTHVPHEWNDWTIVVHQSNVAREERMKQQEVTVYRHRKYQIKYEIFERDKATVAQRPELC